MEKSKEFLWRFIFIWGSFNKIQCSLAWRYSSSISGGLVGGSAPQTGSLMQISVGMKNFSMAIVCMLGKCSATNCLQSSQSPGKIGRIYNLNSQNWFQLTEAVVLLEIDGVLGDHDGVLDVSLHPFQALDALVASVPLERQSFSSWCFMRFFMFCKVYIYSSQRNFYALFSRLTDASCLTNMEGSINKVVLNNCILQISTK